ncbi:hypothetical protein MASR2M29_23930 [Spirochaetota bacterium]
MKIMKTISESLIIQIILTIPIYLFYALILGVSLFPSLKIIFWSFSAYAVAGKWFLFSFFTGCSVFVFYLSSVLVMGLSIRVLSLGIKAGRYPEQSFTVLRWLVYSGIYTMMTRLVLPVVPMSFFSNLFFYLVGCKLGKNVRLNSYTLNDAFLLTLEDGVVIGGGSDISCHLYEDGHLVLQPVVIKENTVIGAHCYIAPGVVIGRNSLIGLGCYIRQGKILPDNTRLTKVGSVSMSVAQRLEKGKL